MKPGTEGSAARVRGLLADALELVQVRIELLTVETREGVAQLIALAIQALLSVVLLSFGLIFFALFCTVLLWDSQRLLALGVFMALFLGVGGTLAVLAWRRFRRGLGLFQASLGELRRDQDRLRS